MIGHFSKWVELVALPDKSSHNISHALLQQVLSRFGACAKWLTNQGSEFKRKFQDLFDHTFIDHHRISRDNPQADALTERMVQTCEKDFKIFASLGTKRIGTWPYLTSPWVIGSLNTPLCLIFFLTFYFLGDIPIYPLPLLFKWTKLWIWTPYSLRARVITKRATLFRRVIPMAIENLSIAQH